MGFQKNDRIKLTITDIGTEGEGIGKAEGYTIFVKDTVPGDEIDAIITKPKKNYAYGRCEKILSPSLQRVEPVCEVHKQCGGCQLQALSYDRQLQFKQEKVRANLIRIGEFPAEQVDRIMDPIIGMEQTFHYRNKAQYPVGMDKNGNLIAGFYAGRTHSIIANTQCALGSPHDSILLDTILSFMKEYNITVYEEPLPGQKGKGLVRHVLIRSGFITGEIMVCLVINGSKLPHSEQLVKSLLEIPEIGPNIKSISTSINKENTNVIMGKKIRLLYGQAYITDYIGDVAFQISPLSFFQVNPKQTKHLYETALSYAGLTGKETVWDLYCGIGTISLFLAGKAKEVYGVEIIPEAIEDARRNAEKNQISNAHFLVGKAEEVLPDLYEKEHIYADVIVVDPPRKGCDEACLNTMLKMKPERIVYVSCDSATLARDLKLLCEKDYKLVKIQPVDMFPMTVHVETVVLMSRVEGK